MAGLDRKWANNKRPTVYTDLHDYRQQMYGEILRAVAAAGCAGIVMDAATNLGIFDERLTIEPRS